MISRLIEFSIRNRFIVILLTAAAAIWGVYCLLRTPIDAIPDLSENQVIVFTDWMGRSPQEIDDQITYPLSVNLQGLAGVKAVRSASEFNFSMINIIFDEKSDFYFARTRVLERLNVAATFLPPGVVPYLAPDSTALGQIFWYTVEGEGYSLDELRAIQDWYVRYQLYVPGVAEVSSVGGFVREYQVDVDPDRLRAYAIPLGAVVTAVSRSNSAVGGKVYIDARAEFLIRGIGWLRGVRDVEQVVVAERNGVPITVGQLASVQLGPAYRRNLLEKDGHEVVGGVVLMRYGENPLDVTAAIKARIEQLQPGLPPGVRIVPFYERTRLIHEAIATLRETLVEELVVASLAILLVLRHVRSVLIVCLTLPLAVLAAFIFMYYLGIPSNIMSLSGIAISIGLFVDAAVVMVENTTHELTRHFGDQPVRGDITEHAVRACTLVGKPIFFAVTIMLVSFIPVFALGGIEGKMFHPLAFTKTFAMIGVAVVAVTFVPAVVPILVKGRLQREADNWIVRSFISIYKPVLGWLMSVPAAGVWFMGFLFIVAAGFIGSSKLFACITAAALFFGCVFFARFWSKALAVSLLLATATFAWHFPKLGREFMPPLDEGSILDMPVTIPRVSIAETADDIRVRDELLRSFPEVDQVVGKVGRAETPTDPSGIDMVETVVSLRPKAWWPKRKLHYDDATAEARRMFDALQSRGAIRAGLDSDSADAIINAATMDAIADFDRVMRRDACRWQQETAPKIGRLLVENTLNDVLTHARRRGKLLREPSSDETEPLLDEWSASYGAQLVRVPRPEEMSALVEAIVRELSSQGVLAVSPDFLLRDDTILRELTDSLFAALGSPRPSLIGAWFGDFEARLDQAWQQHTRELNWQLEDVGFAAFDAALLKSIPTAARSHNAWQRDLTSEELGSLLESRPAEFRRHTFLWHATKADLVKEMDTEVQMPGWGNIWTQPIINRVDMLATGVRTMIGVKVFGPRLSSASVPNVDDTESPSQIEPGIQEISNQVAAVVREIRGAVDVFPDQIVGRSYLQIDVNREKAARYGVNVGDVQDAIEVAMGGRVVTQTVEGRRRFPVRVRYARDFWQTEQVLRRTLVTGRRGGGSAAPTGSTSEMGPEPPMADSEVFQIPVSDVADIRVVEGPSVIKSENGMLRAYVQLNVRDRDIVGFVEEAQRAVADRVKLPPGFYIEWSGQFEHQVRARRTLQIIFPLVILIMFIILYMTFHSVRDALLIMLAVPGALAGGVIFQSLFGFNFSVAVWVGYIACFGEATQTGIVMLVYLHDAIRARGGLASIRSPEELRETIMEGAVHRLRPKLMTEGVAIIGLMPMLWATGVGAEVMRPMAAPVLGGLLVADEVIDLLLPVVFNWYKSREWRQIRASQVPIAHNGNYSPASA